MPFDHEDSASLNGVLLLSRIVILGFCGISLSFFFVVFLGSRIRALFNDQDIYKWQNPHAARITCPIPAGHFLEDDVPAFQRWEEVREPWMLHSLKLTWPLKMVVSNKNLLFQRSIFRGELLVLGMLSLLPLRIFSGKLLGAVGFKIASLVIIFPGGKS